MISCWRLYRGSYAKSQLVCPTDVPLRWDLGYVEEVCQMGLAPTKFGPSGYVGAFYLNMSNKFWHLIWCKNGCSRCSDFEGESACVLLLFIRCSFFISNESYLHVTSVGPQADGLCQAPLCACSLQINIWLSSRSFHAYPEISFQKSFKGKMGITDLNPVFQIMFGESLIVKKEEFLRTFSSEYHYIRDIVSSGLIVDSKFIANQDKPPSEETDESTTKHQIIRMDPISTPVGQLYSRLVPLVLLLVDGGSPIDISDPKWDIYFVIEKKSGHSGDSDDTLLGFATLYRFYHYPNSTRFRISQMLVLPPYQGQGHGRHILETINSIAVSEDVFDITMEEPSDYLQKLRVCVDSARLLTFQPVKESVASVTSKLKEANFSKKVSRFQSHPHASVVEEVREHQKINRKQFLWCWEILLYLNLEPEDKKCMENFRACISERLKAEIIEKDSKTSGKCVIDVPSDFNSDMSFVVFRVGTNYEDGVNNVKNDELEQQINQLVDKRMEEIVEIAKIVVLHKLNV